MEPFGMNGVSCGHIEWLNYHHLLYFWVVAREDRIARACEELRLAEPTISAQIHRLEQVLGEKLRERSGRRLVLTKCGRLAYDYAEVIFFTGREFMAVLKGGTGARPSKLRVGIVDALPKSIACRLLGPALRADARCRLILREGKGVEEFVDQLVAHTLDLVLADGPAAAGRTRVINHHLGESVTTAFGTRNLARRHRERFPRSLRRAPFVVTGPASARRQQLEQWFDRRRIRPEVVAEVDDSSLLMEIGRRGVGLFIGPALLEKEICGRYAVDVVVRIPDQRQQYYAISAERRVGHPVVVAVCRRGRSPGNDREPPRPGKAAVQRSSRGWTRTGRGTGDRR